MGENDRVVFVFVRSSSNKCIEKICLSNFTCSRTPNFWVYLNGVLYCSRIKKYDRISWIS